VRLVLLGPPGEGKGTQDKRLSQRFGLLHLATGDLFRANVRDRTDLGKEVKRYLDSGELVPDDVTIRVLLRALESAPNGFILDGFPRTISQGEALEAELAAIEQPLTAAVAFILSEDIAVQRIAGRRTCSSCGRAFNVVFDPPRVPGVCDVCGGPLVQRSDADEETVRRRLVVYHQSTEPLLDFYRERGLLHEIDAGGTEDQVFDLTIASLGESVPG